MNKMKKSHIQVEKVDDNLDRYNKSINKND